MRLDSIAKLARPAVVALVCALQSEPVRAQDCTPSWSSQFGGSAGLGLTGGVGPRAFTSYDPDDGGPSPPALVVGGAFGTAGGVNTGNIALWNGMTWASLGGGVGSVIYDAVVFDDDGAGPNPPRLHVCGSFFPPLQSNNRIARWNETSGLWETVGGGLNDTAFALAVFDEDGDGPALPTLFVGGEFTSAGGVGVHRLARWNGSAWSNAGAGLPISSEVKDLYVFDEDGEGGAPPALLAGTDITSGVYRLTGQTWLFMGGFIGGGVNALASVDHDGAGPEPPTLYAGGNFVYHVYPNAVNYVARYLGGTSWAAMQQGVLAPVRGLASFDDDGTGPNHPALYVGGDFLSASGVTVNHIARWDGQSWSALDGGVMPTYAGIYIAAIGVFDPDGPGPDPADLFSGGFFGAAGGTASANIAAWRGCPPAPMTGDLDSDGWVGANDLALLLSSWGACSECPADLNGDGVVGSNDLALLLGNWG